MNRFLCFLPLALCPLTAQTEDAKSVCMAALDALKAAQSDDLTPVVKAVMDATGGDERAYWRLMKEAADAGHPVALTWLSGQSLRQLHAMGEDVQSSSAAVNLRAAMEEAARSGYVPALVEMAHFCGSGVGAPADEKKGMQYLMEACKANSLRARAAYLLLSGRLEKDGEADAAVAAELKKNNFHVEEILASLSARSDEARSREWLTSAASHGSPTAACSLGQFYLAQGKEALGIDFLKQAVERGHAESMAVMASLMLPGADLSPALQSIIPSDVETAIRLFRQAALLGYSPALIPLAGEYHKQNEKYSAERVFELYRRAADLGDPRGGVAYAYCLVAGRGCAPDAQRGLRILNQLVDAGIPFANMALADLYFNGTGVPADMARALSSLSAAASAGVPQCYTLMAVLAHLGNAARPADPMRARVYLRMAEERGEFNPVQGFDELVKNGGWKFIP